MSIYHVMHNKMGLSKIVGKETFWFGTEREEFVKILVMKDGGIYYAKIENLTKVEK